MKSFTTGLFGLFLLASPAHAHEEVRQAAAHVHGSGELFLELNGKILTMTLSAPRANFSPTQAEGFKPRSFLTLPDTAGCTDDNLVLDTGEAGHHEDHGTNTSEHADYMVTAQWTCTRPEKLDQVTLSFFETYGGFDTVKVIFFTEDNSVAKSANVRHSVISRP